MTCFIQFKPHTTLLMWNEVKPYTITTDYIVNYYFYSYFQKANKEEHWYIWLILILAFFGHHIFKGKQLPHISLSLNGSVKYLTFQSEVNPIRPYSCGEVIGKSGQLTNLNATL